MYKNTTMRLQNAVKKRDDLNTRKGILQGRLQAAQTRLESIVESCNELGVSPESLKEKLVELETLYEKSVRDLEENLNETEQQLTPYE